MALTRPSQDLMTKARNYAQRNLVGSLIVVQKSIDHLSDDDTLRVIESLKRFSAQPFKDLLDAIHQEKATQLEDDMDVRDHLKALINHRLEKVKKVMLMLVNNIIVSQLDADPAQKGFDQHYKVFVREQRAEIQHLVLVMAGKAPDYSSPFRRPEGYKGRIKAMTVVTLNWCITHNGLDYAYTDYLRRTGISGKGHKEHQQAFLELEEPKFRRV